MTTTAPRPAEAPRAASLAEAARRLGDEVVAAYEHRPWLLDATLIAVVTVAAAVLRLTLIGSIPYGVHSDEAQIGMDARRIMADVWIGPYTHAALGEPTGHAYLATPFVWLFGSNGFALRLGFGLMGLAAVPLLYLLVRTTFGRVEAFFASGLLAVSYWHIFYSRTAHSSSTYPTLVTATLLCVMMGLRARNRWWFAAGGVPFGLGVYSYNVYPIAVVALGVFLAIVVGRELLEDRKSWAWWWRTLAVFGGVGLLFALPMIEYVSDPGAYYWDHFRNYQEVGVRQSPEYKEADFFGKVELIAAQARFFASAYAWEGRPDIVDANGLRPMFDPLTLALLLVGLVLGWGYRREPLIIAAYCCFVIIPLPAVLQRGAIMRQPLGAAPFAMLFAALPLALVWRGALRRDVPWRYVMMGVVAAVAVAITVTTVHDYFWTLRKHPFTREIYFSEMTTASAYMRDLPQDTHVYFYSERASINLESRQYLAEHAQGTDRSREYSPFAASIEDIDRSRPAVFLLMGAYLGLLPDIEARYPGGTAREAIRDGKIEFVAYELPPG